MLQNVIEKVVLHPVFQEDNKNITFYLQDSYIAKTWFISSTFSDLILLQIMMSIFNEIILSELATFFKNTRKYTDFYLPFQSHE